ncbi:uncharacterized protein F4822DRAFT_440766 [Hypoxylon trugodes]|uniref:uncharacterized protein n=1 Tax=Hypoxylon trugodes TaxID=326681 RepID=UPI0021935F7B|nr:uncharacterized protein F4822DRAFT_440766 [Hypoxylon trugodes]KAI1383079.1 hypothetical protein F4822DRAFT_440766 [Hypoxylon trugodes]
MTIEFELGTADHAELITHLELQGLGEAYGHDEFEQLYQYHVKEISKGLNYYIIAYDLEDGLKVYVGWCLLQWNLRQGITVAWPEADEKETLIANKISTHPLLKKLQETNQLVLDGDFLFATDLYVQECPQKKVFIIALLEHLKSLADTTGMRLLSFVKGRPNEDFLEQHEWKMEELLNQAAEDSEALLAWPRMTVLRDIASHSINQAKIHFKAYKHLYDEAVQEDECLEELWLGLGFEEVGPSLSWPTDWLEPENGGVVAPTVMRLLEYIPKQGLIWEDWQETRENLTAA